MIHTTVLNSGTCDNICINIMHMRVLSVSKFVILFYDWSLVPICDRFPFVIETETDYHLLSRLKQITICYRY